MLFTGSLLSTSWIKTRPAQKLLVRVKFTGNPYTYVCERPPLKYTQTCVCQNSYTGTHTVPDSFLCLCEHSLSWLSSLFCRVVLLCSTFLFVIPIPWIGSNIFPICIKIVYPFSISANLYLHFQSPLLNCCLECISVSLDHSHILLQALV